MVDVRPVVDLMAAMVPENGKALERECGAQALVVAQEIQAALMAQFEGNLGRVMLWEQFLRTPEEVALAVVGVVQALAEGDKELADWLRASIERYRQTVEAAD